MRSRRRNVLFLVTISLIVHGRCLRKYLSFFIFLIGEIMSIFSEYNWVKFFHLSIFSFCVMMVSVCAFWMCNMSHIFNFVLVGFLLNQHISIPKKNTHFKTICAFGCAQCSFKVLEFAVFSKITTAQLPYQLNVSLYYSRWHQLCEKQYKVIS